MKKKRRRCIKNMKENFLIRMKGNNFAKKKRKEKMILLMLNENDTSQIEQKKKLQTFFSKLI